VWVLQAVDHRPITDNSQGQVEDKMKTEDGRMTMTMQNTGRGGAVEDDKGVTLCVCVCDVISGRLLFPAGEGMMSRVACTDWRQLCNLADCPPFKSHSLFKLERTE
jgi:hypothetical protein